MTILLPLKRSICALIALKNYFTLVEKHHKDNFNYFFVDLTETFLSDGNTGISRVTNGIKDNLPTQFLSYKTVFVYAKSHQRGFYNTKTNKPIKISKGDFFFGLDLSKFLIPENMFYLKKMQKINIPVYFLLHDLFPVNYPQYCRQEAIKPFKDWLDVVKQSDGFIANSKATEDEMLEWLKKQPENSYNKNIKSGYIHLGSAFIKKPSEKTIKTNNQSLQFLAVSTVEPRKRYDQMVSAFDLLWKENFDISLHIVGKPGWNSENVFNQIKTNPQYEKKLIWHDKYVTDEELAKLYEESSALIFASAAEGFGLAVVEAASYNKPLIVRDIPIFREVTNDQAFFFSGDAPEDLANAIKEWIILYRQNKTTIPNIKLYSWEESAKEALGILFGK